MRHPLRFWVPSLFALVTFVGHPRHARAQDTTRKTSVDIHGFIEVYYRDGDITTPDGYRLRKGDLKFSGDISPHLRWRVGFDVGKVFSLTKTTTSENGTNVLTDVGVDARNRMVQDAALTWRFAPNLNVDIGQQVVPLSLEGTIPTASVETIERTMFIVERSRAGGLGDTRDIGASLNGTAIGQLFEYHVGLFNGTGDDQNTTAPNDQKAVMWRLALHPSVLPGFQFGGSGGFEASPTVAQNRERYGGEAQYKNTRLTLRSEVMTARDGELRRFGYYGLAAARITQELQFVARFDSWDRDRSAESTLNNALEQQYVLGTSYLVDGGVARLVFNIVHARWPNIPQADNTFGLLAFEAVW